MSDERRRWSITAKAREIVDPELKLHLLVCSPPVEPPLASRYVVSVLSMPCLGCGEMNTAGAVWSSLN